MPWEIKKSGSQYCVYKKGASSPVPGGCHKTKTEATAHMKALYKNVPDSKKGGEVEEHDIDFSDRPERMLGFIVDTRSFSESPLSTSELSLTKVQAFPYGKWNHPWFGEITLDKEFAYEMKGNFDANVRGQDIPTDYDHGMDMSKGNKASGWVHAMEVADSGMYWHVAFTPTAKRELTDQEWRYFSPEYANEWTNPVTNAVHNNVAFGGGLTNVPFLKGIDPINLSEITLSAGSATLPRNEHAPEEHSDPGTGQPPEPRKQEPPSPGTPHWTKDDPNPNVTRDQGENDVDLKELLKKLGLSEDTKPDEAVKLLSEWKADHDTFQSIDDAASQDIKLKETFPEIWEERQKEKKELRETKANAFAEKFCDKGVDGKVLPAKFREGLVELHKKFSEGKANASDVEVLLSEVVKVGSVSLGEKGTSVDTSRGEDTNNSEPIKKITARLTELREKDKITGRQALRIVAKEMPVEFKEYRQTAAQATPRVSTVES